MGGFSHIVKKAFVFLSLIFIFLLPAFIPKDAAAQQQVLTTLEFYLVGLEVRPGPDYQAVPRSETTTVNTNIIMPTQQIPYSEIEKMLPPNTVIKGELRGPAFTTPIILTTLPGKPFDIPTLPMAGIYTLENIRMESGGNLIAASPNIVTIESFDKILITTVTTRQMSLEEIQKAGVLLDTSNFTYYNFTAALAFQTSVVNIVFPVPVYKPSFGVGNEYKSTIDSGIALPELNMPAIDIDIPNVVVEAFIFDEEREGQERTPEFPPIAGIIVIPGNIGFLHQFFEVNLIVTNGAPAQSNLKIENLQARIVLPTGEDKAAGTDDAPGDDPLRVAKTSSGTMGRLLPVIVPGPDGKFGTSDDLTYLNAQETGQAGFIVEGLKEGTFPVDFEITATLLGLPKGPVNIKGAASGTVLVRNPNFSINLSHPNTVRAGTSYTLFATIKNTSDVPANLVSISLDPRGVSGAELLSSPTVKVDTILPQSSATVSFQLRSRVTGKVSATVFPTDENVVGRFILRTGIGDNNIPLSPDTLVLPDFTNNLPETVVNSAIGFLGEAYSVATAPNGALPANIKRIKRVVVEKNALALAEAGLRVFLNEPMPNSLYNLLLDFYGSDEQDIPFDSLRRISFQFAGFNSAAAAIIKTEADTQGIIDFHRGFGDIVSNRKPHISAATGSGTGGAPLLMEIADSSRNRLGSNSSLTDINREIPYADILNLSPETGSNNNRQMAILSSPGQAGSYAINLKAIDSGSADISIIIPSGSGLKQIYYRGVSVQNGSKLSITINTAGANDFKLSIDNNGDGIQDGAIEPSGTAEIVNTGPQLISAVQVKALDKTALDANNRVITLLFNERITKESAEDVGNFKVDENEALITSLQPSGRILFLMLRDPIGPYIQRNVTVSGIRDANNASILTVTKPIVSLIEDEGGVLRGQVLSADGRPIAGAAIRLDFRGNSLDDLDLFATVSAKYADSEGRYQYDFVKDLFRISAVDTAAGDKAQLTTSVRYAGQQINLDLIMTGKGSVTGVVKDVNGNPMASAYVQLITFTGEVKKRVIQTDGLGNFRFDNVPVGEYSLDAVKEDRLGRVLGYLQSAGMTDVNDIYVFAPNYGPAIEYGKILRTTLV